MQIHSSYVIKNGIVNKHLKLLCLLICVGLNLSCDMIIETRNMILDKKLSENEIRSTIEKSSNLEEIQAEVDSLFSHYGDSEQRRFSYDLNQVEIPVLTNLADALDGMFIGMEGKNLFTDEPDYVIRVCL